MGIANGKLIEFDARICEHAQGHCSSVPTELDGSFLEIASVVKVTGTHLPNNPSKDTVLVKICPPRLR